MLAVVTALVLGAFATDLGARLARAAGPGLPTGAAFTTITGTVNAGESVTVDDGALYSVDEPVWRSVMAGRDGDPRRAVREFGPGAPLPGDEQPWVAAARARVAAAGWQIRGDGETWDGHSFWATRDGRSRATVAA